MVQILLCALLFVGLGPVLPSSLCQASAQAGEPFPEAAPGSWGDGFPTVDSVLDYTQADDELETARNRAVVFAQLGQMVERLSGNPAHPRPYHHWPAYREVGAALEQGLSDDEAARSSDAWAEEHFALMHDREARDAMVSALFTPEWRAAHEADLSAADVRRAAESDSAAAHEAFFSMPLSTAVPLFAGVVVVGLLLVIVSVKRGSSRAKKTLAADQAQGRALTSFTAGPKIIDLIELTGTVPDGGFAKMERANVSVTVQGGRADAHVSKVMRDDLFLVDAAGGEHALRFTGFDLQCRPGNLITVMQAVERGAGRGPFTAVRNHSTGQTWRMPGVLEGMASPSLLGFVLGMLPFLLGGKLIGIGPASAIGFVTCTAVYLFLRKPRVAHALSHSEAVLAATGAVTAS